MLIIFSRRVSEKLVDKEHTKLFFSANVTFTQAK